MPRSWFNLFALLSNPEPDPSAGGGGGGGEGAAGGDAGAGEGQDKGDAPTMADLMKELKELRTGHEQYRHTTNKELERLRRGRGKDDKPRDEGKDKTEPKDAPVTRDELRAERAHERAYDRDLGRLEALGLDADALDEIEEDCEDLSPSERARHVKALVRGYELAGKKDSSTQEHGRDVRRRRTPVGKGGEPPPPTKVSDLPKNLAEWKALKKAQPARAKELKESGEVDLMALARVK